MKVLTKTDFVYVLSTLMACIFGTTDESSGTQCNQCQFESKSLRAWRHFYLLPRPFEKGHFTPINGQRSIAFVLLCTCDFIHPFLLQVCTDDNSFSIDNMETAANAKSYTGTYCTPSATAAAGSTSFSGDYIEISGKWIMIHYCQEDLVVIEFTGQGPSTRRLPKVRGFSRGLEKSSSARAAASKFYYHQVRLTVMTFLKIH